MLKDTVQVFNDWADSLFESVHTTIPGKIEKYYGHSERMAKVKINVKQINGAKPEQPMSIPPIDNVPVVFPSSSLFNMLFPLNPGDGCMLHFAETGIGNYLNGLGQEVNADDISRFSLTDAICVPGLYTFKNAPYVPDNDNDFVLKFGEKTFTIEQFSDIISIKNEAGAEYKLDGLNAEINGSAKRFVTYFELNLALQTFMTALNLHVHATAGTGPPTPPTTPLSLNITASETQNVKTGG